MQMVMRRKAAAQTGLRTKSGPQREPLVHQMSGLVRRMSDRCTVTVSMDVDAVRVVVFKAGKIVAWRALDTPEGASPKAAPGKETAKSRASSRLGALLKELDIPRHRRIVTDLPVMTTLIRHPRLPQIGRRHLAEVLRTEAMETVPFSIDEVDLAWQHLRRGRSKAVCAVISPKDAMDRHVQLFRDAGHAPTSAYARAAALALATGVPDAIVVHVEPSHAVIVLVTEGLPRVVHQTDLAQGDPQAQASAVRRAVDQLASYQETSEGRPASGSLPLVLTGALDKGPLAESLPQALKRTVLPFNPPFVCPDGFAKGDYAINLGLALADRARTKSGATTLSAIGPSVNLLPARYEPKSLPVLPVGVFAAILVVGALAFNATGRVQAVEAEKAALDHQVVALQSQEREHKLTLARTRAQQEQISAIEGLDRQLQSRISGLKGGFHDLLSRLQAITEGSASTARVSSLNLQPDGFAVVGKASTYEDVLLYAEELRSSHLFQSVRVLRTEGLPPTAEPAAGPAGDQAHVSFQLKASLTSAPTSKAPSTTGEQRPQPAAEGGATAAH